MNRKTGGAMAVCLALCVYFLPGSAAGKDDFAPVPLDELAMRDNPAAPGQHAMILYREINDDFSSMSAGYELSYTRLKVFTQKGKDYGDIQITYIPGFESIDNLKARTVHADGKIVPFDGKVFDKVVVKAGGVKLSVRTFTLPEVEPGSVLEYKYRSTYPGYALYNSSWKVQSDLFTRKARFTYKPPMSAQTATPLQLMWRISHAHTNFTPAQQKDGTCLLEVDNVPGFEKEDFMPPEDSVRTRIDFFYVEKAGSTAEFWKNYGKKRTDTVETFLSKRGGVEAAAKETVAASDPPEVKLQKLYARVQKVTNTAAEESKTAKEEKREKRKDNEYVEDVLKHNYGNPLEINLLYVAMARAAGLEAYSVLVSPRNLDFFKPDVQDTRQLRADVVMIQMGTEQKFLDPACHLCPFGLLPWYETATQGLKLSKQGSDFVTTPSSKSEDAVRKRAADLRLDDDGNLEGTIKADYNGLEALWRRTDEQHEDETARKKFITDEIKGWLPDNATVEATQITGWDSDQQLLHAEAKIKVPGYATSAGQRMLLAIGLLEGSRVARFQPEKRVNPIYFQYPYQRVDDILLHLPEGMKIESVPDRIVPKPGNALTDELECTKGDNTLLIRRALHVEGVMIPQQYYPQVRSFFQAMKARDEQQVVLRASQPVGGR